MNLQRMLLAASIFAAVLASGTGDRSPYVLCVGSNGHVEIELAADACCGDAGEQTALPVANLAGSAIVCVRPPGDCGTCLDIPLTADRIEDSSRFQRRQRVARQLAGWAALPGRELRPVSAGRACGTAQFLKAAKNASLPHLATVILLI